MDGRDDVERRTAVALAALVPEMDPGGELLAVVRERVRRRHRRRVVAVVVAVTAAVALAVVLPLTLRQRQPSTVVPAPPAPAPSTASAVVLPPRNASPETVVRAYVAAINRHDATTGYRLLTPKNAAGMSNVADSEFTNIISITRLRILGTGPYLGGEPGYREAVHVEVQFTLRQKAVLSMQDGDQAWGYVLVRSGAADPWRIADEGVA